MKIPISWLKDYVGLPKTTKELTDGLTLAGHMLDKISHIDGETVIDLELRGNRADCYSIFGIAKEVRAIFDTKLKFPDVINLTKLEPRHIKTDSNLVKRAATIEIKNVKIIPSPSWLKGRLKLCGIDSVNNIVDLTNYVMLEIGEPMHAFDLDKVGTDLEIRLAKNGEGITTFSGSNLILSAGDLVWAKGNKILSVAGAIGEKFNSVSNGTKNILLEAACYDRANIRKTVYRHNLLTEAGIRHEKDLDPNLVETAFARYLYLIKENNWGDFTPEIHDYYPKKVTPKTLKLNIDYLTQIGGLAINSNDAKSIFERLGFRIITANKKTIELAIPTDRTDVCLEADLIEEILRIYGYDKIPSSTLALEIPKNITPNFITQEGNLREMATSTGFDEIISLPFVTEKYFRFNIHPENLGHKIVSLVNPTSPDINYMRVSLLPNLLENTQKAINERGELVELFELGKVYSKLKNNYLEERKIGLIYWDGDLSFTKFKSLLETFFNKAGIQYPTYENSIKNIPLTNPYNIILKKKVIGYGGQIDNIYFAEIDLEKIINTTVGYKVTLWPKYPPQIEDHTFTLPRKTKVGDLVYTIYSISKTVNRVELKDVFENAYTFRICYQDPKKTLTDSEVEKIRNKIIVSVKSKFGAVIKE